MTDTPPRPNAALVLSPKSRSETQTPVERVDRRQPGVPGPGAVVLVLFEVGEERADHWRVEVVDVELAGLLAGPLVGEAQKQPERVTVGADRLRA